MKIQTHFNTAHQVGYHLQNIFEEGMLNPTSETEDEIIIPLSSQHVVQLPLKYFLKVAFLSKYFQMCQTLSPLQRCA